MIHCRVKHHDPKAVYVKILVHLRSYPPYRYVGGELTTKHLLEYAVQHGHDVDVFARDVKKEYIVNGVQIKPISLFKPNRAQKYDVYVSHPEIAFVLAQKVSRFGTPYVGIVHNTNQRTLNGLSRLQPDYTIANSEDTLARIPTPKASKPRTVLYPPVRHFQPTVAGKSILSVNMSPDKGFPVVEHVAHHLPEFPFTAVVGGYGLQARVARANITVVPQTPDMAPIYADARILLHPSIRESYGMTLAEATVAGIPAIIKHLPTTHEVVGSAGVYPQNKDEWITMTRILMTEDNTYAEHRQHALERGQYLLKQSAEDLDRWLRILKNLVER